MRLGGNWPPGGAVVVIGFDSKILKITRPDFTKWKPRSATGRSVAHLEALRGRRVRFQPLPGPWLPNRGDGGGLGAIISIEVYVTVG